MSERKSKKQLEAIKKKYNVDQLWSWSKYNSYKIDPYGWLLKYIKHEKETKTSIYGVSGGIVHDILEKFYIKEITYNQMIEEYEQNLFEMNVAELKYNRKDEEANEKIANKYEECIKLFFQNHTPINAKVITEQFVTIKVGRYIFQGYIDFIHKDQEGNYIITDWKTSTIYVGKKIEKERGQLVLYAEALIQKGVPLEKIKIRWGFLKYCSIEYQLKGIDKETKKNKTKITKELRDRWVSKIENNLKMWLKESGYDELEIEDLVQIAITNNNLDNIPKNISDKYVITDCYVEIPLTQEVIDDLKFDIKNTIDEIINKTEQYNDLMIVAEETDDIKLKNKYIEEAEHLFWTEIDTTNQFYFANLCGYSAKQHKPYKEYLDDLELFVKEDYKNNNKEDEYDDNWLNDL